MVAKAWNVMGGELVWQALDTVIEMLGVIEVEEFIAALVAMRDAQHRKLEEERERG